MAKITATTNQAQLISVQSPPSLNIAVENHLSSSVRDLKITCSYRVIFLRSPKNSISFWKDVSGNKATSGREVSSFRFQSGLGQPLARFRVQANGIVATTTAKKAMLLLVGLIEYSGWSQTGPPVQFAL